VKNNLALHNSMQEEPKFVGDEPTKEEEEKLT
jgi:hypothetical protein